MNAVVKPLFPNPTEAAIERFAELHLQVEALKPLMKQYEDAKKAVLALATGAHDQTVQLDSAHFTILLSPSKATRKVTDVNGFVSQFEWEQALKCLSVSVTEMDKAGLSFPVETTYGARSVKAVVKK